MHLVKIEQLWGVKTGGLCPPSGRGARGHLDFFAKKSFKIDQSHPSTGKTSCQDGPWWRRQSLKPPEILGFPS